MNDDDRLPGPKLYPFDETYTCPACDNRHDVSITFHNQHEAPSYGDLRKYARGVGPSNPSSVLIVLHGGICFSSGQRHLNVKCNRCGFRWVTVCKLDQDGEGGNDSYAQV